MAQLSREYVTGYVFPQLDKVQFSTWL